MWEHMLVMGSRAVWCQRRGIPTLVTDLRDPLGRTLRVTAHPTPKEPIPFDGLTTPLLGAASLDPTSYIAYWKALEEVVTGTADGRKKHARAFKRGDLRLGILGKAMDQLRASAELLAHSYPPSGTEGLHKVTAAWDDLLAGRVFLMCLTADEGGHTRELAPTLQRLTFSRHDDPTKDVADRYFGDRRVAEVLQEYREAHPREMTGCACPHEQGA